MKRGPLHAPSHLPTGIQALRAVAVIYLSPSSLPDWRLGPYPGELPELRPGSPPASPAHLALLLGSGVALPTCMWHFLILQFLPWLPEETPLTQPDGALSSNSTSGHGQAHGTASLPCPFSHTPLPL